MSENAIMTLASLTLLGVGLIVSCVIVKYYESRCKHLWELVEKTNIYSKQLDGTTSSMPTACKWIMQCKHCGNIKTKKVV